MKTPCAVCESPLPSSEAHVQYCEVCGHANPAPGWKARPLTPSAAPRVAKNVIRVRALVDGLSELWFGADRLTWVHSEGARPGLPGSFDEPTFINDVPWRPQWDRQRRASSPMQPQSVAYDIPREGAAVVLDLVQARGTVRARVLQDWFVLTFDDRKPGAAWYEVLVRWD